MPAFENQDTIVRLLSGQLRELCRESLSYHVWKIVPYLLPSHMQFAMPRQFLRFDGQSNLEIRRPRNPRHWARILMFSISDVKSIPPNPLVGRFDNDGSGRSLAKG